MVNRLYLTFLIGLIGGFTFAQSNDNRIVVDSTISQDNSGLRVSDTKYGAKSGKGETSYEEALIAYKEYQGSPFLYGKELLVDLILHNDSLIKDQLIHYDLYRKEIIVKTDKGENLLLNQMYYKGFNYKNDGEEEQFRRSNPTKPMIFYKVHFQNNDFVFCSADKISVTKDTRYIPGQEAVIQRFTKVNINYIIANRKASKVALKKGALIRYLPEKYQAQVEMLKKKLKLKKLNKKKDYLILMEAFE